MCSGLKLTSLKFGARSTYFDWLLQRWFYKTASTPAHHPEIDGNRVLCMVYTEGVGAVKETAVAMFAKYGNCLNSRNFLSVLNAFEHLFYRYLSFPAKKGFCRVENIDRYIKNEGYTKPVLILQPVYRYSIRIEHRCAAQGRTTSSDSGHFTELEKLTGHGNEHSTGQLSIVWTQALFTQALFTYRYKPCSRVGTNTVHVQT